MCDVIETSLWDIIETCMWDVIETCMWDVIETCMWDVIAGMSLEAGNWQKTPVTLAVTAGYFF